MFKALSHLTLLTLASVAAQAETPKWSFGGFIDTQYAYDWNTPANGDRAYTTQPARHHEFNLNLVFLEAKAEGHRVRSRLSLQAGTSVQSNSASEPVRGSISGGLLSRHVQEARVGYRTGDRTWIDAGVFFAHVGAESFISTDNLTLTRSLVADYSPYYLSGIKLTHSADGGLTYQVLLTNGWQNISENNEDKNLGIGVEYASDAWQISYNTMVGREQSPDLAGVSRTPQMRHFHDVILKSRGSHDIEWVLQLDLGFQKKPNEQKESMWSGASAMGRIPVGENRKIALRAETYRDPDQILIVTGVPAPFQGAGVSIGYEQNLEEGALFRMEVRKLSADADVFPKGRNELTSENTTFTTSLALRF